MGIALSAIVTFWVGYMIYKKYKPQAVLFVAGFILMWFATVFGYGQIIAPKANTGSLFVNAFEFVRSSFSSNAANLGLNIMMTGAFAKYMEKIGASKALVRISIKPLQVLKSPYIVLAGTWIVGMCIGLCITSASGLGMLLMVTMFPVLTGLGVSRLSAACAVGSTMCLEWSPADTGNIMAAGMLNMDPVILWVHYKVPIAIVTMAIMAPVLYFTMKYYDKKDGHVVQAIEAEAGQIEGDNAPAYYALLPIIPLFLIIAFSKLFITSIKMHIINAMLISLFVAMIVEVLRTRDFKKICDDMQTFFDGMGLQMANVVTLIVAGQAFAKGLMATGTINTLIDGSKSLGFGPMPMMVVMCMIIFFCAIIMGSGNAPFYAFASLAPTIAAASNVSGALLLVPMQFASSIARTMSPITAVIVVCAGMGNVSPFDMAKRLSIPMVICMIINFVMIFGMYAIGW